MISNDLIVAGSGGVSPCIYQWDSSDIRKKPTVLSRFPENYSVYSIAICPYVGRIASASRNGFLRVIELNYLQPANQNKVLFEVFHRPSLTSVSFLTDDLIASGGLDGKIRIWSVSQARQLADIDAHAGGILALRQLGPLVLASIGQDGVMKIWDMDDLAVKYESNIFALPSPRALISLDFDAQSCRLMHSSANGRVHTYKIGQTITTDRIDVHEGNFTALACGRNRIATAGKEDCLLKVWSNDFSSEISSIRLSTGLLSVAWLDDNTLMTIDCDHNGRFWKIDDDTIAPMVDFTGLGLRVGCGLSVEQMINGQVKADKTWRNKQLSMADSLVDNFDSRLELVKVSNQLQQRGFTIEPWLLLTDAAAGQGLVSLQLDGLLTLANLLPPSKAVIPILLELARLLKQLKEPKLARQYYENALSIDSRLNDVKERIARLNEEPFIEFRSECDFRADLIKDGIEGSGFEKEIEKNSVLNRKFSQKVIFKKISFVSIDCNIDFDRLLKSIVDMLSGHNLINSEPVTINSKMFFESYFEDAKWLYIRSSNGDKAAAMALKIKTSAANMEFESFCVFDASLLELQKSLAVRSHNEKVINNWKNISKSAQINKWFAKTNEITMKAISEQAAIAKAKKDDEF